MNIVVAMDSFKGSLSSIEAGQAVRAGITQADPSAQVTVRPLADGGEGTVEALISGMGGQRQQVTVTGPLGAPVVCTYGILPATGTAVVEMSGAAGLPLVPEPQRDPLYTTTYGVGEVIRHAIAQGCRRFLVGIGGSATNDGGVGMLQALGYGFWDAEGRPIPHGAQGLSQLARITLDRVLPQLAECQFRVACDVTNVLCGPQGCSAVYGPQKGATPEMVQDMDQWLDHYAQLARAVYPDTAHPDAPGTGAAGGLGFAFQTFTRGVLEPGVSIVLEETHLEKFIREADLVITGEGRLDGQTSMGTTSRWWPWLAASPQTPLPVMSKASTPSSPSSPAPAPWSRPWNRTPPGPTWPPPLNRCSGCFRPDGQTDL